MAIQFLNTIDAHELQDPKKVLVICVAILNSILNKLNITKTLIIDVKQKNVIKLDVVELDKWESHAEENFLPKDGLYIYLYQPGEQRGDKKIKTSDLL